MISTKNITARSSEVFSSKSAALSKPAIVGVTAFLYVIIITFVTINQQRPPLPLPANAPPSEFAAGRAIQHLQIIAKRPHPIGSQAHAEVRNYIIQELTRLGISTEVQSASVAVPRGAGASAATVQNIVARLKGREPSAKAILLAAHYDSVPNGPGASDDGSGVITILETMRALKASPTLRNDVIGLFTDGEEVGLMGAKAFVNEHPWAKEVGLALNFEARGAGGPVFMFETSEHNGWLIQEFAKAVPYPFSSSLMYSIYKLMPNDTDLTVFRKAGLPGFNFAYIDNSVHYHSQRDNLQTISEGSVQHDGSYALALTRHFGNLNLENALAPDAIYFDILGSILIRYSSKWVMPLTASAVLLFVFAVILGVRKKQLTISGLFLGFLVFILSMAFSILLVWFLWALLTTLHRDYTPLTNADLYIVSFMGLALALISSIYLSLNRWISFDSLSFGALLAWLILTVLLSVFLPGAMYLSFWPLVFSLIALISSYYCKQKWPVAGFIALCVGMLPGIVLMAGTMYSLFQGLSLGMLPLLIGMCALLGGLLTPLLEFMAYPYKWAAPTIAVFVGIAFLVIGNFTPANSEDIPRSNSVYYSLDVDSGEAIWASTNRKPDEWSMQFFTPNFERRPLPNHFPNNNRPFLVGKAPSLKLDQPELKIIEKRLSNGIHTLGLHIGSPRQARVIGFFLNPEAKVLSAVINGKRIDYNERPSESERLRPWELTYNSVPPEGIGLTLTIRSSGSIKGTIVSQTDGFPEIPETSFKGRPAHLIPSSNSDVTRVSKSFILDGNNAH